MKNWLIIILAVFLLAGCIRKEPADTTAAGQGTTQTAEQGNTQMNEESEKTAVKLCFDSLPEILPFAGKNLAELGYTENDLQDNMYLVFETDFLGKKQEVKAFVESWNEYRCTGTDTGPGRASSRCPKGKTTAFSSSSTPRWRRRTSQRRS